MSDSIEKHYNLLDAANILGVKVRTLRSWVRQGKVKATKYEISKRWFISESELKHIMSGKSIM